MKTLEVNWKDIAEYRDGKVYLKVDIFAKTGFGKSRVVKHKGEEILYSVDKDGYRYGSLFGHNHKRHRVVMILSGYNLKQDDVINHKNGIPGDDRLENLEVCTQAENSSVDKRVNLYSTNKTGVTGVIKVRGGYIARGEHGGEKYHLGKFSNESFDDPFFEAVCARKSWENSKEKHTVSSLNKHGHKGILFLEKENRWCAFVYADKKQVWLPRVKTKEEAIAWRKWAESQLPCTREELELRKRKHKSEIKRIKKCL